MYFVHKAPFVTSPFYVCYRAVETVDQATGLPLTYTLRAMPGIYDTEAEAQVECDRLNAQGPPPESEE